MSTNPYLNERYIAERLQRKLNEVTKVPITTIIAPMGYGKSTALDWWANKQYEMDEKVIVLRQMVIADSVSDFWHGVCRVLRCRPELAERMEALGYPKDISSMRIMLELLEDALIGNVRPVYYVLDDIHILESVNIAPLLLFLHRQLPRQVHIILLSRNPIFTDEEKMRLGSSLSEITVQDLKLESKEIMAYAKCCGLQLQRDQITSLADSSEGWISMIYLNFKSYVQSGILLVASVDIYKLIDLVLLIPLPERTREFLILIGITDEFTLEQAAYLWKQADTKELLEAG